MKRMKCGSLIKGMVIAVLSLMAVSTVSIAADDNALREIQDREQINKLMWDYARALDTGNVDAFVALFTEDGQFGRGESAVKGKKALLEMMGAFRKSPTAGQGNTPKTGAMYHMTANHYIEFKDRDHAVFNGYWIAFVAGSGQNTQPTIVGVGREVNEIVRVNGKWLIQVRDIMPKD
ncbi:MAG: nuclear transport factor 2 family protein [Deltaproteobacteria bacterium]|nr:nuclear transport factor 2 family protein [Deltaproteobacteria bacterium]